MLLRLANVVKFLKYFLGHGLFFSCHFEIILMLKNDGLFIWSWESKESHETAIKVLNQKPYRSFLYFNSFESFILKISQCQGCQNTFAFLSNIETFDHVLSYNWKETEVVRTIFMFEV